MTELPVSTPPAETGADLLQPPPPPAKRARWATAPPTETRAELVRLTLEVFRHGFNEDDPHILDLYKAQVQYVQWPDVWREARLLRLAEIEALVGQPAVLPLSAPLVGLVLQYLDESVPAYRVTKAGDRKCSERLGNGHRRFFDLPMGQMMTILGGTTFTRATALAVMSREIAGQKKFIRGADTQSQNHGWACDTLVLFVTIHATLDALLIEAVQKQWVEPFWL